MLSILSNMVGMLRRNHSEEVTREGERAQDAFEYLLIIGGVSVAIIVAVAAGGPDLITWVIDWVETAIGTIIAPVA